MFIKRVCYPVQVLGCGNRAGIWLAGCERHCAGCMSPELQTTKGCRPQSVRDVMKMLKRIPQKVDGITISGGEPFLQSGELYDLIQYICSELTDDIILYTGYRIEELQALNSSYVDGILSLISVLVDGEYIDELNDGIGLRGSSNQRIIIFRNPDRYKNMAHEQRKLQTFRYNNQILIVGIQ